MEENICYSYRLINEEPYSYSEVILTNNKDEIISLIENGYTIIPHIGLPCGIKLIVKNKKDS